MRKSILLMTSIIAIFLISGCSLSPFAVAETIVNTYRSHYANQSSDNFSQIAQRNQIIGYWKFVQFPENTSNGDQGIPGQNLWFKIDGDGNLFSYSSNQVDQLNRTQLEEVFKDIPSNASYTFKGGKMEVVYNDSPGKKEVWGIEVVTTKTMDNEMEYMPGDLLLGFYDNNNEPVDFRYLKKIK